ncbi:hypothetical protein [Bacillus marasmi]|uniref:hypothetical protein n=1 Tax=Bacillus marasmi TaxID=1926279 RepID=UPI0011C951CA|nr:hypothetical protein [Bacillus marasmi]
MIKNKKFLYLAIIFFLASITLNVPFPHKTLYGATVYLFNIPIKTLNGLNYVGITSLLLLILSLYFLVISLNKYHARFVVITIIVAMFLPSFVVSLYQKTFATGIYSISYDDSGSHCSFQMKNETTLHGKCELPLKNNSRNDVQFTVEFYEPYQSENDIPMVSLMNKNTSYNVMLRGKESKRVKFETNIDVSKMKEHINSGEITGGVNVIIKSGAKSRKL